MDVFSLRDRVIERYHQYVQGFVPVRTADAGTFVARYFAEGHLWPEPLVQLNPSFEPGRWVHDADELHPDCGIIFRRRDSPDTLGEPIRLHRHQDEAIRAANSGKSYVLTTGTGSGKSLAYFIPIVDHILRHGPGQGIKAIVVYPMNALANSQEDALERFLEWGYPGGRGPVRFAKYTGQENEEARRKVWENPPDILLTNFVMLELILTRIDEQPLVRASQCLEFLVLDELHTYRGRQGADVAMLVRRVRERCGAPTMRCVSTSATLAGTGIREERQAEVAEVASRLFGDQVPPENVIVETLQPATGGPEPTPNDLRIALQSTPEYPTDFITLSTHPLACWSETAFGLQRDAQGRLERREPRTISDAAQELAELTGIEVTRCAKHLRALLLAGFQAKLPETGFPLFAFRLHQFVSRGTTVYTTLEPPDQRWFSPEGQVFKPGDRDRRLYPLAFCRMCGQDYLVVALDGMGQLERRDLDERAEGDDSVMGYLVLDGPGILDWTEDYSILPEEWTELRRGELVLRSSARKQVPLQVRVTPDGRVLDRDAHGGHPAWFLPAPFRLCLGCGATYASAREKDFSRLAGLSSEGRSTATTILSIAIVQALRDDSVLNKQAHKLLSFTDNRQDASLQAGHFNDFVQVTLLRSAILQAVLKAGSAGLSHDEIAQRVVEALALYLPEYASNPQVQFAAKRATDDALRDVIGYRVYHDLRRGWRITSPNLEQVGLLKIEYEALDELCASEDVWQGLHPVLAKASPEDRERACQSLLHYLRRGLAIKVPYLEPRRQEQIRNSSFQYLHAPWGFDENERLQEGAWLVVGETRRHGQMPY